MDNVEKSRMLLGVAENASPGEIGKAYRAMVKTWHPDLFHDDPKLRWAAEEKIKEINEARRILCSRAEKLPAESGMARGTGINHAFSGSPQGSGAPRAYAPPMLLRCNKCGQLNGISRGEDSLFFVCCKCGNHLENSGGGGRRAIGARWERFGPGDKKSAPPTLDYIKFLAFCACSISIFILAGIGTLFILWAGSNLAADMLFRLL